MKNLHQLTRFEKGGGGNLIAQAPVPAPAPPVTMAANEVVQAAQDLKQQELLRKSIKKTVFAGDTGGWGGNPMKPGPVGMIPGISGPAKGG
jgi:hypothetical protein